MHIFCLLGTGSPTKFTLNGQAQDYWCTLWPPVSVMRFTSMAFGPFPKTRKGTQLSTTTMTHSNIATSPTQGHTGCHWSSRLSKHYIAKVHWSWPPQSAQNLEVLLQIMVSCSGMHDQYAMWRSMYACTFKEIIEETQIGYGSACQENRYWVCCLSAFSIGITEWLWCKDWSYELSKGAVLRYGTQILSSMTSFRVTHCNFGNHFSVTWNHDM